MMRERGEFLDQLASGALEPLEARDLGWRER